MITKRLVSPSSSRLASFLWVATVLDIGLEDGSDHTEAADGEDNFGAVGVAGLG